MSEREFFEKLGFDAAKPMVERRDGGFITEISGRAEYRSAHRALPPMPAGRSPEEYERRFERLLALCRETDKILTRFN